MSTPSRRLLLSATVLVVVAVLAIGAVVVVRVVSSPDERTPARDEPAEPGPVLVLPGYGGSSKLLRPLVRELRSEGRETVLVRAPGDGTGDLRKHAGRLDRAADDAIRRTGATSVDVVGYSAGGIAARYWIDELGGASTARRVLVLASPQHGTSVAAFAASFAPQKCPRGCRQLVPGSKLLTSLNKPDETPAGPEFVSLSSTGDQVVPTDSARLDGALNFTVQDVCPKSRPGHMDLPSDPVVLGALASTLGSDRAERPTGVRCAPASSGVTSSGS